MEKLYSCFFLVLGLVTMVEAFLLFLGRTAYFLSFTGMLPLLAELGVLSTLFSVLFLLVSLFYLLVAVGLWNRRGWTRIAVLLLGLLVLFKFPVGTITGVLTVWLFGFERRVTTLFRKR